MKLKMDYYDILREAIHKKWDPVGIYFYSQEMGEYDGYLPNLYELLKNGGTEEDVFNFLWIIETESLGLEGDENATRQFSKLLIDICIDQ